MNRSLAERASFRDHAGHLVERDGVLQRVIEPAFLPVFRAVQQSGLLGELQRDGLLIAHEEIQSRTGTLLQPERVPFISYPYEWTPRQLRAAAVLTLEVAQRAFRRGIVLRDASAFNVQFLRGRPVLIDTLSFEPRTPGAPWLAYGQFCRHFLGPLALGTLVDPQLVKMAALYPDGVPVSTASRTLGWRGLLRAGLLVHLKAHAAAEAKAQRVAGSRGGTVSDRQLQNTLDGLRATVEDLPVRSRQTHWLRYQDCTHYDASSRAEKERFVAAALERVKPRSVWDLGANRGHFTFAALPQDGFAVALDADLACVDECYAQAWQKRAAVTCLWSDVLAPAAPSGWANEERAGLAERGPADLVLGLALIHHICIGGRVPLDRVAAWFARIGRHALIEVPDADDPMVQRIAAHADATRFGRSDFQAAAAPWFDVVAQHDLAGLPRTLFLLRSRV